MYNKQKSLKLILFFLIGYMNSLYTQSSYDIQLKFSHFDALDQVAYYDLQLRSSSGNTWGLAGQNYRLYYNASKAEFQQGTSSLPKAYQAFTLVQHVPEVDGSSLNGGIEFSKTMGFLNFAIDLNNTTAGGGVNLTEDGTWITTIQLAFKTKEQDNFDCLEAVWGQNGTTNTYAASFVEISEWVGNNNTEPAIGINYYDLELGEELEDYSSLRNNLDTQSSYDIQLKFNHFDALDQLAYYDLQLRSSSGNTWGLAGQNYRLYYNASKAEFQQGTSSLPKAYQAFTLVQHVPEVDGSSLNGGIEFSKTMGFLNFAIDLNNTTAGGGVNLTEDGTWITTIQLAFKTKEQDNFDCLEAVWGQNGTTNTYAASFVEISEWVGNNNTEPAIGINYYDLELGEELEDYSSLRNNLDTQSSYDIQLKFNHFDALDQLVYYDLQLRSSSGNTWGLAGQNYRLYYNASKAEFQQGTSSLPKAYQAFTLVQHVPEVDGSSLNGGIEFSKTMGFLNFAIDLNNTTAGGVNLTEDGTWLTTVQLAFKTKEQDNFDCLETIWGRNGTTNTYAASFVEISEWVGNNNTEPAIGINYYDLELGEELELGEGLEGHPSWIKILLQGAYGENGLMHDSLRKKGYVPLVEPYSGTEEAANLYFKHVKGGLEEISADVLNDKGDNSIVDWVFLELRNKDNPAEVETTRSALLQRNGRVVDTDGISPVRFSDIPDSFYLVVRHRNHLGVMSKELLTPETIGVDFSDLDTKVFGLHARIEVDGAMFLRGGNADGNGFLIFQGGGVSIPDSDSVFFDVFTDPTNKHFRYNHITKGYYSGDTNMDGEVRYQGIDNDLDDLIFFNIIRYPENNKYLTNYIIKEQIAR